MRTTARPAGEAREERGWRLSRALVVAVVASCLAFAGHLVGGGQTPHPVVMLMVVSTATIASWATTRVRWTPRSLTGVLLLVQAAAHLTCGMSESGGSETPMMPQMLAAHVVATAASVVVIGRGETVLLRLFEALLMRPTRILDFAVTPVATPRRVRPYAWVDRLHALSFVSCEPTRGPPVTA